MTTFKSEMLCSFIMSHRETREPLGDVAELKPGGD